MTRKVVRLTLDLLEAMDSPCVTCLFWELDPVRRSRVPASERRAEQAAWVSRVLRDWGSCGRIVLVDDTPAGLVVYAPPVYLPGASAFPTAPASPDAVLMTHLYVDRRHRGGGLARMLVQGMARDLITRDVPAIEAFGSTRGVRNGRRDGEAGGCVLPVDFLGSVGFATHRAHLTSPRMRMELRSALTWREEIEAALARLVGVVRPTPKATFD